MKNVILVTSRFPYSGGEQFLETEIEYYDDIKLTILPKNKSKSIKNISKNIKIDNYLVENSFKKYKIFYLIRSLSKKIFYKELLSENFLNLKKLKIFFSSIYLYQMYYELFDNYFSKYPNINDTTVYTYWHDETSYALQSLKSKYNYKFISRIHRGDLYREINPFCYMPLKKNFTNNIDTLCTITQSANQYLEETYLYDKRVLKLNRLGVNDKKIITKCSEKNCLNIVSCSFLLEVKQIDKIIKSLKIIATKMKDISFNWIHIGDGILYDDLILLAKNELSKLDNLKYNFTGNYVNEKVYEFYLKNNVDVFLNVSLSEGVPVSIMEAMSCHIPIIAPDVGGIKDMVINGYNGVLLSDDFDINEVVDSLKKIEFYKKKEIRENSYKLFLQKYNAAINYKDFIKEF